MSAAAWIGMGWLAFSAVAGALAALFFAINGAEPRPEDHLETPSSTGTSIALIRTSVIRSFEENVL